jgi:hypothetical protein
VYAVEWEAAQLRFYVDGVLHYTINETANRPIFETPMNIIVNLAVGGHFGGDPNGSTIFPQHMDVDYVRFWEPQAGVSGDYNRDGAVDAADYVVWRKNPDAFGGDPAGYNTWRANFGTTAGGGATLPSVAPLSAVPEPATSILLALAILGPLIRRAGTSK